MSEQRHRYLPGWVTDADWPTDWRWVKDDPSARYNEAMAAWRYCPVCGDVLLSPVEAITPEPRCAGCNRPVFACPCACITDHGEELEP
jgi:hypothetical protein